MITDASRFGFCRWQLLDRVGNRRCGQMDTEKASTPRKTVRMSWAQAPADGGYDIFLAYDRAYGSRNYGREASSRISRAGGMVALNRLSWRARGLQISLFQRHSAAFASSPINRACASDHRHISYMATVGRAARALAVGPDSR